MVVHKVPKKKLKLSITPKEGPQFNILRQAEPRLTNKIEKAARGLPEIKSEEARYTDIIEAVSKAVKKSKFSYVKGDIKYEEKNEAQIRTDLPDLATRVDADHLRDIMEGTRGRIMKGRPATPVEMEETMEDIELSQKIMDIRRQGTQPLIEPNPVKKAKWWQFWKKK